MADYTAYFGGQWMPFSEVRIDPLDRGFLVGDCVFDVARTFNGESFRMRELAGWSETVGVDIVAEAVQYASREQLESPRGS